MARAEKPYSVRGCTRGALAREMCRAHYNRWLRWGDPLRGGSLRTPNLAAHKWLADHEPYRGSDCLLWPFGRDEAGRAKISIGGKTHIVSRFLCEKANGPAPGAGFHAAHSCGNASGGCVNPEHLRWATPKENNADKILHGTLALGENCNSSRLTDAQATEILEMKGSGRFQRDIAKDYGVNQSTISDIWSGRRRPWMEGR